MMDLQIPIHPDLWILPNGDYGWGVAIFNTTGWSKEHWDRLDAAANSDRIMTALEIRRELEAEQNKSGLDIEPSPLHHQPKGVSNE